MLNVDSHNLLRCMLNVLKVYGISTDRGHRRLMYCFKFLNASIVFVSLVIISSNLIMKPVTQMNIICVALIVVPLLCRHVLTNSLTQVLVVVNDLMLNTDNSLRQRIVKHDRIMAVSVAIIYPIEIIMQISSILAYGSRDFVQIVLGMELESPKLELIGELIWTYYYNMINIFVCFYCHVQYIVTMHAQSCCTSFSNYILLSNSSDSEALKYLKHCQIMYKQHLDSKRTLNTLLGFIPFAIFSITFIFIVVGISYLIVNEATVSISFILLSVTPCCTIALGALMLTVRHAADATDMFKLARLMAGRVATDYGSYSPRVIEEHMILFRLISTEKHVHATGWGFFDLNRQLLLNFANAVIPFAVMIITATLGR